MNKFLCLIILILIMPFKIIAQPVIETSERFFESKSNGWTKVLLLKNGNTFYVHFGGKIGLKEIVFGKDKKIQSTITYLSERWAFKHNRYVSIVGFYEINNEPVIFLQYDKDKTPTLFRIRLNANDGSLVEEEIIGSLPQQIIPRHDKKDYDFQNIFVEKDETSDCYAVIFFNYFAQSCNERIKAMHFDGKHKLLNSAYLNCQNPEFNNINFMAALVDSNQRIYITSFSLKTGDSDVCQIYISKINANDKIPQTKKIGLDENCRETTAQLIFNHNDNTILTLSNSKIYTTNTKTKYYSYISTLDPESLVTRNIHPVSSEKVSKFATFNNGMEDNYYGVPQKMILNDDSTITILSENITKMTFRFEKQTTIIGKNATLGNIGITEFTKNIKDQSGYIFMKNQYYNGYYEPMRMIGWAKGVYLKYNRDINYSYKNPFMSYDYIHTPNKNYVIFNDDPKNIDLNDNITARKKSDKVDVQNTVCYTIQGGVTSKSYLFGAPHGLNKSNACYIEGAHWNNKNKIYTTVLSEQHRNVYYSKIAWIHFEK